MAGWNQLVNIALIIGVGYVAITYGPDIVKNAKKAIDDIYYTVQQPGAGVQNMTLPQPQTYQPPPPYGTDVVPEGGGGTSFTPTPPYGSESTQGPMQVVPSSTGVDLGAPSGPQSPVDYQDYTTPLPVPQTDGTPAAAPAGTANVPITPFPTPAPGAIPSQQHLAAPVKSKSKKSSTPAPTRTQLQQQQAHLQNSQTSRGNPVSPPRVTVSQAHPASNAAPARPGQGTITTRFPRGTPSRDLIEAQIGCHCAGKVCCFRGHTCDGAIDHECTTASSTAKPVIDAACAALRQRFLNKNPCNASAPVAPVSPKGGTPKSKPAPGVLRSRFPPKPTTEMALNPTVVPVNYPPITAAPCSKACDPFKNSPSTYTTCCRQHLAKAANAGYAYGEHGEIISLDSMFVTIA